MNKHAVLTLINLVTISVDVKKHWLFLFFVPVINPREMTGDRC